MASRSSPKTGLLYTKTYIQGADSTALMHHRPVEGQGAQLNAQASNVQGDRCTDALTGKMENVTEGESTAVISEGLIQSERSGKISGAPQEHWRVRMKKKEKKRNMHKGKKIPDRAA